MAEPTLLVVDDEEFFRENIGNELTQVGYRVQKAANLEEARRHLSQRKYHIVLLDMRMPDGNGLDLLPVIKETAPASEVVMLTAFGTIEEAIRAMKLGAFDFLTKPVRLAELEAVLEKALQKQRLDRSYAALRHQVERLQPATTLVGHSPQVREVLRLVERVAQTDSTVLIRGDSGVGKELVASAIHRQSARAREPFVVVDCASLHENLLQSELFGHEKGAYTGAVTLKNGLFEVADQGTLFLDEIGELTPSLQVKLLRVLETSVFRRLGGTADIHVEVRVIAATNRSLETMMSEGAFRDDLYYRLNVFSVQIPPLRERRDDIPILIEHFIRNSTLARQRGVRVSPRAMDLLMRYSWPGNVRELKNMLERALILCDEGVIEPEHMPIGLRSPLPTTAAQAQDVLFTLEEAERRHIRRVLEGCGGHRQRAAQVLGISERTLYRKLQELDPSETR